jgi:hypothetical protein
MSALQEKVPIQITVPIADKPGIGNFQRSDRRLAE